MKNNQFNIALYIRVSTEDQAENPEGSIRNQTERLKDYIKMKSFDSSFGDIVEIYCDPGVSAKDMNRPAFQRMMTDIETKKINLVMVTELSRLTRSTKDFAEINEFFKAHDCKFLSLRDNFDSTTAAGEMIMLTIANFAQFERRQLGERISNAFQARSKRGLWNGGALPLGYEVDPDKSGHLKIIPAEAEIVQNVFEFFLKHETLAKTGKALNAEGIAMPRKIRKGPKFRHPHFTIENVYRLLTNKAYIGVRVYKMKNEVKEVKACWNAIIDESIFNRVQRILKIETKHRKQPSQNRFPYLLSGVLYCKSCGDRLCGKSAHGRGGKIGYYEHAHFAKNKSLLVTKSLDCDPKRILAYKIEPIVWSDVRRLLLDADYAKMIFDEARKKSDSSSNQSVIGKLEQKMNLKSIIIESLVKRLSVLPEGIDEKPFYDEIKSLQNENLKIREEIERLKTQDRSHQDIIALEDFQKFTQKLKALAENEVRPEAQAAIIRKLVNAIHVTPDGIEIQYFAGHNHFKKELGGGTPTPGSVTCSTVQLSLKKPHTKPLNKYTEAPSRLPSEALVNFCKSDFSSVYGSTRLTIGRHRPATRNLAYVHDFIQISIDVLFRSGPELQALYEQGHSVQEVAEQLGISYSKAQRQLVKQKVTLRSNKSVSFSGNLRQTFKNSAPPPYGYCYLEGRLQKDPREYPILQIIEKQLQLGRTPTEIAKFLSGKNFKTRHLKEWKQAHVFNVIQRLKINQGEQI